MSWLIETKLKIIVKVKFEKKKNSKTKLKSTIDNIVFFAERIRLSTPPGSVRTDEEYSRRDGRVRTSVSTHKIKYFYSIKIPIKKKKIKILIANNTFKSALLWLNTSPFGWSTLIAFVVAFKQSITPF